jgi:hypothetical protein
VLFLGTAGPLTPGALIVVVRQLFFADSGLDWQGLFCVAVVQQQARRARVCIRSVAKGRLRRCSLVTIVVTVVVAVIVAGFSGGSSDLAGVGGQRPGIVDYGAEPPGGWWPLAVPLHTVDTVVASRWCGSDCWFVVAGRPCSFIAVVLQS